MGGFKNPLKGSLSGLKEKVENYKDKRKASPVPGTRIVRPGDSSGSAKGGSFAKTKQLEAEMDERELLAEEERNMLEFKMELLIDMLVVRELDRERDEERMSR
jgi:hypothetical protein